MRRKTELLPGEWAILALLCERPAHGYAIAAEMSSGEVGRIWALSRSLVYRSLDSLVERGLIEATSSAGGERGPRRTLFAPTAQGRALVEEWLSSPIPHVRDLRTMFLIKLWLLNRAGRPAAPLLGAQRELLLAQEQALAAQRREGDELEQMIASWRWGMTAAALRFVEQELAVQQEPER